MRKDGIFMYNNHDFTRFLLSISKEIRIFGLS